MARSLGLGLGAPVAAGVVAGALVGGALAAPYYGYDPYYPGPYYPGPAPGYYGYPPAGGWLAAARIRAG